MRKINQIFFLFVSLSCLCLVSCKDEESPQWTSIEGTFSDPIPSRKGAVVEGMINGSIGSNVSVFGFLCSLSKELIPDDPATMPFPIKDESFSVGKSFKKTLTDLEPGKQYYYCMYVSNGTNMMKTQTSSFTTLTTSKPLLGEMKILSVGEYSLSASCGILDNGGSNITQCGFFYKKQEDEKFEPKLVSVESFQVTIDKLSPGTMYYIYPFATNKDGTINGDTLEFTTEGFEAPVVLTNKVGTEALGSDWAILSGSLENSGSSEIKEMGFCYTTVDKDPVKDVDKFVPVKDKKDFTYKLTGLVDKTKYYVRAYAKNGSKAAYGERIEFVTKEYIKPICETVEISNVTDISADVQSKVKQGSDNILRKGFCYSNSGAPELKNATILEVTDIEGDYLKATITGLSPNKKYFVRAFVETGKEVSYGPIETLETSADPTPVIGAITFTNVEKTSFAAHVTISSSGSIKKRMFLYSSTNQSPKLDGENVSVLEFSSESATISGLKPNTQYYVCVYVLGEKDKEVYSAIATVKTVTMGLPVVSDVNITREGNVATVRATVTSESEITECGVCYSTVNTIPSVIDSKINTGLSGNRLNGQITNLKQSTIYYIRVYATSVAGTVYSDVVKMDVGDGSPNINDNDNPDKN